MIAPLLLSLALAGAGDELPPDSLYHLEVPLEAASGELLELDAFRGRPVLVSLFYARCPHTCPMLISALERVDAALDDDERAALRVLLVSLTPERDTPDVLREVIAKRGIDEARWSLTRPRPEDLRALAAALSIRYRALPDGSVNHTGALVLLDREGRVAARTTSLLATDPTFLAAVKAHAREP